MHASCMLPYTHLTHSFTTEAQHLATYKAPKAVYLASDFPRTKNGKILRRDISPAMASVRSS